LKPLNLDLDFNPNVKEFIKEIEQLKKENKELPLAVYIIPFLSNPTGITFSYESSFELIN